MLLVRVYPDRSVLKLLLVVPTLSVRTSLTNNTDNNKIQYFYFMPIINENYIQFFTAVCHDWLPLLKSHECKDVIVRALPCCAYQKVTAVTC